jgi:transcriptional regulator with XRE-family HTH domain
VKKGRRGAFAERLRAARRALGLTQEQAAEVLSSSRPSVARWECGVGEPQGPARAFVEAWIAEALGKGGDHA